MAKSRRIHRPVSLFPPLSPASPTHFLIALSRPLTVVHSCAGFFTESTRSSSAVRTTIVPRASPYREITPRRRPPSSPPPIALHRAPIAPDAKEEPEEEEEEQGG
ncbi:hypothetical protein DAI22_04g044400 [Oryza sativa Japonica Group]|nr:hypothetical protein DAI22_04g044400 [Oryza sativa Japonica Group]